MNIFRKKLHTYSAGQLLCGGLLAILAGTAFFLLAYPTEERAFHRICSELFVSEMTENTLNMHYTIAHPEDFGISDYEAVLPVYSAEHQQEAIADTERIMGELALLDSSQLDAQDAYTYRLLTRSLETSRAQNEHFYYEEPLSPSSGMQTQLLILIAEYTFRNQQDVEDYLNLLDQTDEYLASLLTFEQEKAAAGLFMSASSLNKVREQCNTIVTLKELESGTHFLQITFAERLAALTSDREPSDAKNPALSAASTHQTEGCITPQEAAAYTTRHNRLLKTVLLPAYEALSDGLFLLEEAAGPLAGLAATPRGKEYYETLLIAETGSYRPIPEIKELLSSKLREEYEAMRTILTKHPEVKNHFKTGQHQELPLGDSASILGDLQARMASQFPSLLIGDSAQPSVSVKSLSANMEDYCAPAFYLTPPIDNADINVIYINQKHTPQGLDLYTTLAHEGYPGHLYQTVYNSRSAIVAEEHNVRQLLWYGGYLEGWALHVEFLSYDYASQIMEERDRPLDALCIQLEKHNRSLQLCLFSILDIMIHYENASYHQAAEVLEHFGVANPDVAGAVYTYITETPCNYLKYYLGYLEIMELQKKARTDWGAAYSDYAFHSFYLNSGPSDFTSLAERLTTFSPDS